MVWTTCIWFLTLYKTISSSFSAPCLQAVLPFSPAPAEHSHLRTRTRLAHAFHSHAPGAVRDFNVSRLAFPSISSPPTSPDCYHSAHGSVHQVRLFRSTLPFSTAASVWISTRGCAAYLYRYCGRVPLRFGLLPSCLTARSDMRAALHWMPYPFCRQDLACHGLPMPPGTFAMPGFHSVPCLGFFSYRMHSPCLPPWWGLSAAYHHMPAPTMDLLPLPLHLPVHAHTLPGFIPGAGCCQTYKVPALEGGGTI